MNIEKLKASQIDYDMGLYRFMNNVSLYEGLLKEFVTDNEYISAKSAYERKDYQAMFKNLHAMKGATGNLGMNTLYKSTCELVEILRHEDYEHIDKPYLKVQEEYATVIKGITDACDET
ncbi:MAG: Hpt domain-containing protein [Clostridia bacterium]